MSTTNLFVELIVIGFGGFIALCAFVFAAFGFDWLVVSELLAILATGPLLSLIYILGIVIDRISDSLFHPWARRLRLEFFPDKKSYVDARIYIYINSDPLRELFEYSRSRLRVSRGWAVNALLILPGVLWLFATNDRFESMRISSLIFSLVFFGGLAYFSRWTWAKLARAEYRKLLDQYLLLQSLQKKKAKRA